MTARNQTIPKLVVRVRFPSPALTPKAQARDMIPTLGLFAVKADFRWPCH
jgi:hypothetical protein